MAIEDIQRLKEKLEKDPNSKLFVPLAEEYKKAGMLDEAVDVLTKGLEIQPSYLSARVSLGKIYTERGMFEEAKTEFEKVIAAIPDNLYAHKKLAEVYRDLGEKDKAIAEFRTVVKLNPMDESAADSLALLQAGQQPSEEKTHAGLPSAPVLSEEPPSPEESEFGSFETNKFPAEERIEENMPEEQQMDGDEDVVNSAKLFPLDLEEESSPAFPPEPAAADISEETISPEDSPMSSEDMELWKSHLAEIPVTEKEELPSSAEVEGQEEEEASVDVAFELPDEAPSFDDLLVEAEATEQEVPGEFALPAEGKLPGLNDADQYISAGKYGEAMNTYRKMLSGDPDNPKVLQRVEELKSLLKLLGKDKEELVAKLEHFLDGIRKRRDEFSGST